MGKVINDVSETAYLALFVSYISKDENGRYTMWYEKNIKRIIFLLVYTP